MYENRPHQGPPAEGTRREAWLRQTAGVEALRRIVEVLGPASALPVKGIVTGRTLYADPAERPLADVDVRVEGARALDEVVAFARREGHEVRRISRLYGNVIVDVGGVDVDVERTIGPPHFCGLSVREMLARATVDDALFGFACARPERHDHALLMCVNVFKDKLVLVSPCAVEDLRRVVRAPDFDAAVFAARARAARVSTLAWIVADSLAGEEGAWALVRDALGPVARPRYARAFRWLSDRAPGSLAARVVTRLAPDDVVMRARGLAGAALWEAGPIGRARRRARG